MDSASTRSPTAEPSRRDADPGPPSAGQPSDGPVVVMALLDIEPRSRLWGWSRIVMRDTALRQVPGLRFSKVLGSGYQGGFGLRPSASIQGLFCAFSDEAHADAFVRPGGALDAWRSRSRECFSIKLRACSSRGSWSGHTLATSAPVPASGPVASLTRASIRPTRAAAFWRMQPAAERSLTQADGVRLAVGVGEAPLLRQATFSLWDDVAAMDRYARSGAHREAIRAAANGHFFSESMFVRFVPYDARGRWQGRSFG